MIVSCRDCAFLDECGGLDDTLGMFGCHDVLPEVCRAYGWTCPWCELREYIRRQAEVQARTVADVAAVAPTIALPLYVPALQHPNEWSGKLLFDVVAIPTRAVVGGRGRGFGAKFKSREELQRRFHLGPKTEIILVSVTKDPFLESYWRWAKETRTADRIADLGIAAITIPNFSFFSNAPRPHLLYNRRRLAACLNELAAAGIPVIPHLHALTTADRAYWRDWLRHHPNIRYVCREWQTGNGEEAIDEIARIQDEIGRDLHPIIVGGGRFLKRLRELFRRCTIVDSTPFMKGVYRQRAVERDGEIKFEPHHVHSARAVGRLIEHNIALYKGKFDDSLNRQMSLLDVFEKAVLAGDAARRSKQTALPFPPAKVHLPVLLAPSDAMPGKSTR